MNTVINTLEFNKIIGMLCEYALSDYAKQKLTELRPYLCEAECRRKMGKTTEAKAILENLGAPPLTGMKGLADILELASKGGMLSPNQLQKVAQFIIACKRMKQYLKKAERLGGSVAFFGESIGDLSALFSEIDSGIRNDTVDDNASPVLRDYRRKIENMNLQIKNKLDGILRNNTKWFADGFVAIRNGRFVLPVKKEYKNQVSGSVIDTSSSGGTCFIEPSSVRKLQEEMAELQIEEENEIRRILYTLSALVDEQAPQIRLNAEAMGTLDILFAKAKLSADMKANPVPVTADRRIVLKAARHPLLSRETCIPLDFEIGGDIRGVVITGPNTGGKTVALKTVGLLSLMAQSGLHIPAKEGSTVCLHNLIHCDIGDGQSITENLSTFSSHITNIIEILRSTGEESLVLLDELGSGTDPAEGMGIAVSVLEELRRRRCLFVVTTHYPEIKEYAANTEGTVNARMAFDRESLRPLYRLEMGEAGESCALYIAKRLGFPPDLLQIAHDAAYHKTFQTDIPNAPAEMEPASFPKIEKEKPQPTEAQRRCDRFHIGDSVLVYPQKETGIVYQTANERGEVGVQVKKRKQMISHKRLKLQVAADQLYPEDYDFSIIFDTVSNRKARHQMGKRHDPHTVIEIKKENE